MGAVECLWEIFGGTTNSQGFRTLDSHVGLIYGDAITLELENTILEELHRKGFAADNIVFGVGSFTYQYITRDTYGAAIKATYGEVYGEARELVKDPITDNGTKKSAKGLLRVEIENDSYVLYDQQTWDQEEEGELELMFINSRMQRFETLADIRKRLGAIK
jgi:nicotinamide phosphoribosyltransferase